MSNSKDRKSTKPIRAEDDRKLAVAQESALEISVVQIGGPSHSWEGWSYRTPRKPAWPATCRGYCRK